MSEDAFKKASHREGPDGVLAVAHQKANTLSSLDLGSLPTFARS